MKHLYTTSADVKDAHPHLQGEYPEQSQVGLHVGRPCLRGLIPAAQGSRIDILLAAEVPSDELSHLLAQVAREPAAIGGGKAQLALPQPDPVGHEVRCGLPDGELTPALLDLEMIRQRH